MDWVGQTHALGTNVAQVGSDSRTKIATIETLPRQRRLMYGSAVGVHPTMDGPPFAIGTNGGVSEKDGVHVVTVQGQDEDNGESNIDKEKEIVADETRHDEIEEENDVDLLLDISLSAPLCMVD